MEIELRNNHFILSPNKTLFWIEKKILCVADLHLTKENHFRKNGISVPLGITYATLKKLETEIELFNPDIVLFLGDLFHSEANQGMKEFISWRKNKVQTFQLIPGNHDILYKNLYDKMQLQIVEENIFIDVFSFAHEPKIAEEKIHFCGHLHPSFRLLGKAKQSFRLPCFYYSKNNFVLPAFGEFTGTKTISPKKGDRIFAIAQQEIFEVNFN